MFLIDYKWMHLFDMYFTDDKLNISRYNKRNCNIAICKHETVLNNSQTDSSNFIHSLAKREMKISYTR